MKVTINSVLAVAAGGAGGACLRYVITAGVVALSAAVYSPLATLACNLLGCFLLGCLAAYVQRSQVPGLEHLVPLLGIGFCGGFTTFSTFALDFLEVLRSSGVATACAYFAASMGLGVGMVLLGTFAMGGN